MHLIWKQKGRRDDGEMYRPIALTLVFRKILEKILYRAFMGNSGVSMKRKAG